MGKELQFGCKKCGSVVSVEAKPWPEKIDIRVKDGKVYDHFGKIEIQCKKCHKPVAIVSIEQV
jgi:hypothetical protein